MKHLMRVSLIVTSDSCSIIMCYFYLCVDISVYLLMFGMFEKPSVPLAEPCKTLKRRLLVTRSINLNMHNVLLCALTPSSLTAVTFYSKLLAATSGKFESLLLINKNIFKYRSHN